MARNTSDQRKRARQAADPEPAGHPGRASRAPLLALLVVLVLLAGIGLVRGWPSWMPNWLPSVGNPFQERTIDRSGPAVLQSVQDLSRYTAASGNFEVVIDVETDRRFIPDIISGERVLFIAVGSVDAYVEFGGLAEGAIVVDEATDTVEITLPPPQLTDTNIDNERSYVYSEQRGVANRIRDFFGDDPNALQQVLLLAEERIAEAAAESELRDRAEANTRTMLRGMLSTLGFDTVTVTFESPE